MFIDATYEGDLMAAAGVTYTVGRESNDAYGETLNGVQVGMSRYHQFAGFVDPYIERGNPESGLLPGIRTTLNEYKVRMTRKDLDALNTIHMESLAVFLSLASIPLSTYFSWSFASFFIASSFVCGTKKERSETFLPCALIILSGLRLGF